jgi:hypothetical protein
LEVKISVAEYGCFQPAKMNSNNFGINEEKTRSSSFFDFLLGQRMSHPSCQAVGMKITNNLDFTFQSLPPQPQTAKSSSR